MSDQVITIVRSIGSLTFDAVFDEAHDSDLEVTDSPVETGVTVSDHAFMKPLRLTISAGVSDVMLRPPVIDPYESSGGRATRAYELLTALQKSAEPFAVQTGLKLYRNMICATLHTSQNKETYGALFFTATLREVLILSTQTIVSPRLKAGATKRQAGPKKQLGEQQGKDVKQKSLAAKLKQYLTGVK